MCYSQGHPVRLIGGRLALDFVNTADWTADDLVAHEKFNSLDDLQVWLQELEIEAGWNKDLAQLKALRRKLRAALLEAQEPDSLAAVRALAADGADAAPPPLTELLSASAVSVLADPRERGRLKMCPADDCGWLFIDETKNSRRTWCSMETCGNRAKAARHYQRKKEAAPQHQ